MKESELIALLNLYLDNEIGAADAARLEAEVAGNAKSRSIYRQYCRLHKACTVLADHAREEAPAEETARIIAFTPPSRRLNVGIAAAGLMAAACVALILVERKPSIPTATPSNFVTASAPAPVRPSALDAPAVALAKEGPTPSQPAQEIKLQPVFTLGAPTPEQPQAALFAWMNRVQMAPVQNLTLNPSLFTSTPVFPDADARTMETNPALESPVERVSFQFQK